MEHLRSVLTACCESSAPDVRGRFLILTHMGPDPDALGACEGLRLLLENAPAHPSGHYAYAQLLFQLGRPQEALRELQTHMQIQASQWPEGPVATGMVKL